MPDFKPAYVLILRIKDKITFPSQQCLQLFSSSWTALCSHLRGWNSPLCVLPSYSAFLQNRWPSDTGNGSYAFISPPPMCYEAHTSVNIPFRNALPFRSSSSPPDPAVPALRPHPTSGAPRASRPWQTHDNRPASRRERGHLARPSPGGGGLPTAGRAAARRPVAEGGEAEGARRYLVGSRRLRKKRREKQKLGASTFPCLRGGAGARARSRDGSAPLSRERSCEGPEALSWVWGGGLLVRGAVGRSRKGSL